MKKRILSICMIVAMLLVCTLPAFAADAEATTTDYDELAAAAGYQARVGTAEEAYDGGKFTGYFKFKELRANNREGTLDGANEVVKLGDTVTLIADVNVGEELSVRNRFTLDGNGKTLYGAFRAADDGNQFFADVTVKNLTIKSSQAYVAQINSGHKMVFEDCTIIMEKSPAYAHFVARGVVTLKNCTVGATFTDNFAKDFNQAFFIDQAGANVTLENTVVTMPTGKETAIYLSGASTLNLRGTTTLNGAKLKIRNANAVVNKYSTIADDAMVEDNNAGVTVNVVSVWDGTTVDTSWYAKGTLEYTLDSAAKVAGLAKLCADAKVADYPSVGESTLVTFYITCDIDLGGFAWTPIGISYAYRFQGHIIGKKNGVDGAAITVYNMNVPAPEWENVGFVGTADAGSNIKNLIFVDPVVDGGNYNTAATVVGYARGQVGQEPVKLENIQVLNGKVLFAKKWGGGIVAYSKYSPVELTNCVFTGDIIATSGSQVGGLVGGCDEGNKENGAAGAVITNCYAGGTISANADGVGGFIGYTTAKAKIKVINSQCDMLITNTGSNTGMLVGDLGTVKAVDSTMTLNNVLVSGLSFGKTEPEKGFALIGRVNGDGKLEITAANCVKSANLALYGERSGSATVEGGTGITMPAYADMISTDANKGAALIGEKFVAGTNRYPVLALAQKLTAQYYGYADYAWIDLSKTELEIATRADLVGFSTAVKAYNFAGKTVKLTADIDGSGLPHNLAVGTDGTIGALFAECIGTFDKNGHAIKNMTFTTAGEIKYTIIWDWNNGDENAKVTEEYKYNETPVYKGENPTRANDDTYSYTFIGWDKRIVPVTADITFKALWKKTQLETATTAPESTTNAPANTPTTEAPTAEAPAASSESCKSSVAGVFLPLCLALAGVAVMKKSRKEQ